MPEKVVFHETALATCQSLSGIRWPLPNTTWSSVKLSAYCLPTTWQISHYWPIPTQKHFCHIKSKKPQKCLFHWIFTDKLLYAHMKPEKNQSYQPTWKFCSKRMPQTTQSTVQLPQAPFDQLQLPVTLFKVNFPQFQVFKLEFTKCPVNFKLDKSLSIFLNLKHNLIYSNRLHIAPWWILKPRNCWATS